jgi:hypothetical protein
MPNASGPADDCLTSRIPMTIARLNCDIAVARRE